MKEYALGLYEKAIPSDLSWKEKLSFAKECGYDFLEISVDETDWRLARLEAGSPERQEILEAKKEIGFPITSMCLSGHRKYPFGSEKEEQRSLDIMVKALDLAEELGVRIIQLAGYDVYYEEGTQETRARFLKNLKKAADLAAAKGIVLGFETMETPFMDTVWKAMYYVQAVNSPWLQIYPDSGNLTNASLIYKHDVLLDLKQGAGHIAAMHLKETIPGHYREIEFFTGHVAFDAMIETDWSMGVRRYVTEMWYTGSPEWKTEIKTACTGMKAKLDRQ